MTKQQILNAGWVAMMVAWRAFQAAVVVPGALAGCILATFAITEDQPVQSAIKSVHAWAEKYVRPAPAGMLLVPVCIRDPNPEAKPVCKEWQEQAVPIADVVDGAASKIATVYSLIVSMSIGVLFMTHPGRAFIGLPEAADEAKAA